MARNIAVTEDTPVFRAVITKKYPHSEAFVSYEGPYLTAAAAKARVSYWVNYLNEPDENGNPTNETFGHVETGKVTWTRVAP